MTRGLGEVNSRMADIYGTEGRLLEQLALHEELSISKLARESGLSYPTAFYATSSFPFVSLERVGKEKRAKIRNEMIDVVYPFLIALQTSRVKKVELTLAFLARKGFNEALIGGEPALQMQLYVRDADPDPEIELRVKQPGDFFDFVARTLHGTIAIELRSNLQIVKDRGLSPATRIGLVSLSRPEKILVDAIAEKKSRVFVESVAEAIVNSFHNVDMSLLSSYAGKHGVFDEAMREIKTAQESGFP